MRFVIFSQTFAPDPAAVGQQMTDLAAAMAARGHEVQVFASSTGYDDPSRRYPLHEMRDGYEIRRIPFSSFGKKTIAHRIAGTSSFMSQVAARGLLTKKPDGILFSTSPPMIGTAVTRVGRLRGVPTAYWAMDLNPDQLITLGKIKPSGLTAKVLEANNRNILRHTDLVIALDRFMADRLRPRVENLDDKLLILPPWPHDEHAEPVAHEDNPFRREHGLEGKFVIMYSGNHSFSNPLDTVLDAAERLKDDDRFRFMFVGGGIGKPAIEARVRERGLTNAICLPYQPIEQLRYSLSAADVHVVSLGSDMVGIIHPCKVYGAMAVARPILFLGPRPSHVSDLLDTHDFGRHVTHGDIDAAVGAIRELADLAQTDRDAMGNVARDVLNRTLSQKRLTGILCDRLEAMVHQHKQIGIPTGTPAGSRGSGFESGAGVAPLPRPAAGDASRE